MDLYFSTNIYKITGYHWASKYISLRIYILWRIPKVIKEVKFHNQSEALNKLPDIQKLLSDFP